MLKNSRPCELADCHYKIPMKVNLWGSPEGIRALGVFVEKLSRSFCRIVLSVSLLYVGLWHGPSVVVAVFRSGAFQRVAHVILRG